MSISTLILLGIISFIQNMAFTWVSRSRNSGDPAYHRYAAWSSNGIWFVTYATLLSMIWEPIQNGDIGTLAIAGVVYVLCTTEGSVLMMRILLGHVHVPLLSRLFLEKGKRKVGAK